MQLVRTILFAKEMERMTAFYAETLGLRRMPDRAQPGWEELDAGGVSLALHAVPAEIATRIAIEEPAVPRGETPIKLVFRVANLEAERGRLVAAGVRMGEVRAWGGCDGIDPEGNVFQLVGT